jgi:Ribonuclease G/E
LRDIGGIIVIDFIEMESEASRARVDDWVYDAVAGDKFK